MVYGDYPPKPAGQADGGAEFVQHLAEGLATRGFGVTAVVSRREGRAEPYVEQGVRVAPIVDDWRLRAGRRQFGRLRQLIASEQIEVIHLVYPDPYLRYGSDSYHLPFLLGLYRVPLLVTFFGFGVTKASLVTKAGLAGLFASADRIVITDAALLRTFRRRLPFWSRKSSGGFVGAISGAGRRWSQVALSAEQSKRGLASGFRYAGFFGFWGPGKGLEDLIAAVARLRAEGMPLKLVIIGGRETEHRTQFERELAAQIKQPQLADAVIETGYLPPDEVVSWLMAMDVCVLPFKTNPLGRSSLALALTVGVPTIVTRPWGDEAILAGVPLLDEPDEAHIAAALRSLLNDPAEQLRSADAAASAGSQWSWDSVVDQYGAMYCEMTRRGKR